MSRGLGDVYKRQTVSNEVEFLREDSGYRFQSYPGVCCRVLVRHDARIASLGLSSWGTGISKKC